MIKLLRDIDFGEPDANAEYFISLRSQSKPLYIRAWSSPEINNYSAFVAGQKFIITGQKGTGKTAILRHMEDQARASGYDTEFVVFKNEILRETELLKIDHSNLNGSVVDEEKLKGSKFYYHAIKRVMVALLVSKLTADKLSEDTPDKDLLQRLFGKSGKEALRIAFDSILNVAQSVDVDVAKVSKGVLKIDPGQLLKKSNDDLLNRAIRLAKSQKSRIKIFFDEMHFAFRDKDSLRSDAALVRDTILAAQALNERFSEEGIDVTIYIALRREFLDQPEIAQADIVHVVESYGESISWEHYPAATNHPIFEFIALRFRAALGTNFSRTELFETYFKEVDPLEFLEYTWSKPRDMVRFFKLAQAVDGNTIVINHAQYRVILRKYCAQAWQESKSALGAFVPIDAIPFLERGLKNLIPGQMDGSLKINSASFQKAMKPAFDKAKAAGVRYDLTEFCSVLYMMGIFYYVYLDSNGRSIFQQYHRGNTNPTQSGEIRIHSAIAKALS